MRELPPDYTFEDEEEPATPQTALLPTDSCSHKVRTELIASAFLAGAKKRDICATYGYTPSGLDSLLYSDAFKTAIRRIRTHNRIGATQARALLQSALPDIADRLVNLCLSNDKSLSLNAIREYNRVMLPNHSIIEHREGDSTTSPRSAARSQLIDEMQALRSELSTINLPADSPNILRGEAARPRVRGLTEPINITPTPTPPSSSDTEK